MVSISFAAFIAMLGTFLKQSISASIIILLGLVLMPISASAQGTSQTSISLQLLPPNVCLLNLRVYPEKRIPRIGNWNTIVTAEIFTISGQSIGTVSGRSDNAGNVTFNICDAGIIAPPGIYNFYVRGFSHLRKYFPLQQAFDNDNTVTDLTTGGRVLLAGETSNVFDNKINSLDASTQIRFFYRTDDEKNDLNRDGKANSLDFSNTVYNFYRLGD